VREMQMGREVEKGLDELVQLVQKRKGLMRFVNNIGDMMKYRIAQQ